MWYLGELETLNSVYNSRLQTMPDLVDEVVSNSQTLSTSLGILEEFISSEMQTTIQTKDILRDTIKHVLKYSCIVLVIEFDDEGNIVVSSGNIGSLALNTKKDKLGRLKIQYGLYNGYRVGVLNEYSEQDGLDDGYDTYVLYKAIEYNYDLYPILKYKPVLFDAVNEYAIKKRLYSEVENGFSPKAVIFKQKDVVEDDESDMLLDSAFRKMIGSTGDALVVFEYERGGDKPELSIIDKKALGSEYLEIRKAAEDNIKRFFHIPTVLYGEAIAGKLGQNNEFAGAVEYVREYVVKPYVLLLKEVFNEIEMLANKLKTTQNEDYTN